MPLNVSTLYDAYTAHVAPGRCIRCLSAVVCSVVKGSSVQFHQDGRDQSVDDNFAAASQFRAGKEARARLLDESEKRELIVCVTFKTVT